VAIWKAAGGFDAARSQPLTWMTAIARNRAIDSLRRAQAQPRTVSTTPLDDDQPPAEGSADEGPGPAELLDRASHARALGACLERLSPSQRQSVALAFFDGLSHAEVADHLRQPLGTVKSWVRRALQTLKSCLDHGATQDRAGGF
jgi:RNA polymerase sigma-70 factor (ECF subfamily)